MSEHAAGNVDYFQPGASQIQGRKTLHSSIRRRFGVYTDKTFTKASDVDVDHIVPLAHAHRHGAEQWTHDQRRTFANDFENLMVVDDAANQSKSDQAPHEWLPPRKEYWCEYGKRWTHIKGKYRLWFSSRERETLGLLAETCR